MTNSPAFTARHVIDAPRAAVWEAWTDAAALTRWFAPKGATLQIESLSFCPGGRFHYALILPDGQRIWGLVRFLDIAAPARLVQLQCFSDAAGGIRRNPRVSAWPLETRSVAEFADIGGGTQVTVTASPEGASAAESLAWRTAFPALDAGWGGAFDRLALYLAKQHQDTRQGSTTP